MLDVPYHVQQDLVKLLPASVLNEVSCFVFYDDHPRDNKCIDITVCTERGEVMEFYKRDIVKSVVVDSCWKPQHIEILRDCNCDLFYLISFKDEIAILSRMDELEIIHKISNVETYKLDDSLCSGRANLKILYKDDAVPLFLDDNFKKLGDRDEILNKMPVNNDDKPIIMQLARKLIEAQYSVKCNEKILKDLINLRQLAAYSDFNKCSSKSSDAVFRESRENFGGNLEIINKSPRIKICNKKIAVIVDVVNQGPVRAENVHILLHTGRASTVYTTKLYEKTSSSPFWKEKINMINSNQYTALAAVVDLKEIQENITSKINLSGVISFKTGTKEHLLPFNSINLSSLDIMGEKFDALTLINKEHDIYNVLALLATTENTELQLQHIKKVDAENNIELLNLFCEHLNMEQVAGINNFVVHRVSPYHILHGVMVIEDKIVDDGKWIISLHTRSPNQILAFMHYIHDAIPHRIVVTSRNYQITTDIPQLSKYCDNTNHSSRRFNTAKFKESMLKQMTFTLQYLDKCMIKMNESKNPAVQSKIGSEIDIFADGIPKFKEFRNIILEELSRAIHSTTEENMVEECEGMVIDSDSFKFCDND